MLDEREEKTVWELELGRERVGSRGRREDVS